ncbi:hypothetical protein FEV13_00215 (plasmid) [Stutzerimonas degradans]|nr:hypothetical protein FEV13_00215 [Stutzerimonas degradans]
MSVYAEIQAVMSAPGTSHWLREALREALQRDPVDAANDAEALSDLLNRHCAEKLESQRG